MKHILLASAVLGGLSAWGGECVPLWPAGKMPHTDADQIAAPSQDVRQKDFDRAAHRMPYLEWSVPPKAPKTDACMIIISGGGYNCTCDRPAFLQIEKKLLDNGITCVWLWYRSPRPKGGLPIWQSGWEDGQRAVRLVRAQAQKRGFDPEKIGVVGCSAGSHLSVTLATSALTPAYAPVDDIDKLPCHINWAIPMCPAYVLSDGFTAKNEYEGQVPGLTLSPAFKFDAKTCPMCFFHGGNDPYSPNGSTRLYRELRKRKIPAELHLDAERAHGLVNATVFERALEFMRQMGFLGKLAREQREDHRWHPDSTLRVEKTYLWPKGKMPKVAKGSDDEPYLDWYIPTKLTTKAIQVIFAGGGYNFCNYVGEAVPVAYYLNQKGMTAVCVKYRCPRPEGKDKHLFGWTDAQRAIRIVRAEAAKRGLDPDRIGAMGFSAGGHLTLMTALSSLTRAYKPVDALDNLSCSVQWACPIYPAYVLTDGANVPNTTGGNADEAVPVPEFAFDAATPPMCLIHGDADGWAAMNSVKVWERLRLMGIQSDLHTLAKRGHCFQMSAAPGTGSYTWLDRIWDFYTRLGINRERTWARPDLVAKVEKGELKEAQVSWWGYDPFDATAYVQAALDSKAEKITIDARPKPWYVRPLFGRSNLTLILPKGTTLMAKRGSFRRQNDSLLTLAKVHDVTITGGGTMKMWISDYTNAARYAWSEWRHMISILSSSRITISNLTLADSGGDGVYLGNRSGATNTDIVLRDLNIVHHNRQGVSVITADRLLMERCLLADTCGTLPMAGIDFEPNHPDEMLRDIVLRDCVARGNRGSGFDFSVFQLSAQSTPISITLENCKSLNNTNPTKFSRATDAINGFRGKVLFRNCLFEDGTNSCVNLKVPDGSETMDTVLENCRGRMKDGTLAEMKTADWGWKSAPIPTWPDGTAIRPTGVTEALLKGAKIMDAQPGKSVSFKAMAGRGKTDYLVYADAKRTIHLSGIARKVGRAPFQGCSITVSRLNGHRIAVLTAPTAFDKETQMSFEAPEAGFYILKVVLGRNHAFAFTAADAPVAMATLNSKVKPQGLNAGGGTLYLRIPPKSKFALAALGGGGVEMVHACLDDAAGTRVLDADNVTTKLYFALNKPVAGVWKLTASRPSKGCLDDYSFCMYGLPTFFFLSPEKTWELSVDL